MKHSMRSVKRRNALRVSQYSVGVSVDANSITLTMPGRRRALVLSRREADITLEVLATLRPRSRTADAPASGPSLSICGSDNHA